VHPYLLPTDTFVDFACGQNTFAPLLTDAVTKKPLRSVSFDVLSPADLTAGFTRKPWTHVDAVTDLPAGELVIGVNPPFGFQNKQAIEFVEHALCAQPRLLVLIMPMTNYCPRGYELIIRDDRICRGGVFYTPGSTASNVINASKVMPIFLLYRRIAPGPPRRVCQCSHKVDALRFTAKRKREIAANEAVVRRRCELQRSRQAPTEAGGVATLLL